MLKWISHVKGSLGRWKVMMIFLLSLRSFFMNLNYSGWDPFENDHLVILFVCYLSRMSPWTGVLMIKHELWTWTQVVVPTSLFLGGMKYFFALEVALIHLFLGCSGALPLPANTDPALRCHLLHSALCWHFPHSIHALCCHFLHSWILNRCPVSFSPLSFGLSCLKSRS